MFAFAAHTGARRSELLRSELAEIDLVADIVTIREKKRVRGRSTTRQVAITPALKEALVGWLSAHPGGPHTFCMSGDVLHSGKRDSGPRQLTCDEAHDHFKRTHPAGVWFGGGHAVKVFRVGACGRCLNHRRPLERENPILSGS